MKRNKQLLIIICLVAFLTICRQGASFATDLLAGPIPARVVRVVDGDTLLVRAHIWLGQEVETAVRVGGIDTPEMKGQCEAERAKALVARGFLADRTEGKQVLLYDVLTDKYGGRVRARVQDGLGIDLSEAMIKAGLARRYDGGKREPWCAAEE